MHPTQAAQLTGLLACWLPCRSFGNVTDVLFDECTIGDVEGSSPHAFFFKMHSNCGNATKVQCRIGDVVVREYLYLQNKRPFFNTNHRFSGEIIHSFCIFNSKVRNNTAFTANFRLYFALKRPSVPARVLRPCTMPTPAPEPDTALNLPQATPNWDASAATRGRTRATGATLRLKWR